MSDNFKEGAPPVGVKSQEGIDPDPFTIATLALGGAGLMLQFASVWRQYNPNPHQARHRVPERSAVEALETAITGLQADMRKITRAIDYGSGDPELEFYRAPLRIGKTSLVLPAAEHDSVTSSLADAYAHLSAVARWTNNIIGHHPDLASEIGAELDEPLTAVGVRLNAAMESGRPVGEVIAEFRHVLEIVAAVLEKKLRERSN